MAYAEWSSDNLAAPEQFACWRDELLAPLGITAEPEIAISRPFRARAARRSNGPLRHITVMADPHRVLRGKREIARQTRQGYSVYRESGDGCWFRVAGQEFVTNPGDFVVTDADVPWESRAVGRYRLETVLLPKPALQPHLPGLSRPLAIRFSGLAGPGALAADYLASLIRQCDEIDEATAEAMTDIFARLIAIACGAAAAEHPTAVRAARLAEAKRYSDRHLADGGLSPARVAAALGMSVRSLHLLFEPTGVSFARYVTRRRLHECRAALASPLTRHRPVADIAFSWGFNSLPTFYRAFHREFGAAPGEVRRSPLGQVRAAGCVE
jgi:AraC-like DNA-binding protein